MAKLPPEKLVPFPGVQPAGPGSARYVLSNLGRVYRVEQGPTGADDDYTLALASFEARANYLVVRLNGGRTTMSVPKAIQEAFGNLDEPKHAPDKSKGERSAKQWRLRINPDAPIDEKTSHPRCSVVDVQWIYGPTSSKLVRDQISQVPPHHVIPIWVPDPASYPRYRDLRDFYKKTKA